MLRGTIGLRPALRDGQLEAPVGLCPGCQGEVYHGERLTRWEGQWICPDCFEERVAHWLRAAPGEAARALGLDRRTAGEEW